MAGKASLFAAIATCMLAGPARAQNVTIDTLILYTPGTVGVYGSIEGVETRINHLVGVTNQIYENSQVAISLRTVHIAPVAYNDTANSERALNAITFATDQFVGDPAFVGVEALRRQVGADLVILMRPYVDDGICGVAWIGGRPGGSFASPQEKDYAYSHVSIDCSDYVLAHELGHNMGLVHSRRQNFHGATLDYALGYGVDNRFVDVMAYAQIFNAQKVYKFSSPLLTCLGLPCGVDRSDVVNSADAALALNTFKDAIAGYLAPPALTDPVAGDFDGDGDADILWISATGRAHIDLLQDGRSGISVPVRRTLGPGWQIAAPGDFDGDRVTDVVFRNTISGEVQVWLMNGANVNERSGPLAPVSDLNWQIAGAGDLDGDGKDDIVWRNQATGENTLWIMDGAQLSPASGAIARVDDRSWRIAQVADFNRDGRDDILWRNSANGQNAIFVMQGRDVDTAQSAFLMAIPDTNWVAAAAGDLNADGFADIVWRNRQTGSNAYWLMNGKAPLPSSAFFVTIPDAAWSIRGAGDFNRDGFSDILWSHATTDNAAYFLMSGAGPIGGRNVLNPR